MNIFYRPKYRSEVTSFIDELKTKDPALEAKQREGRDLLWDKNIDRTAWVGFRDAEVEQQPYVYQTNSDH
ncbi:DUF3460 family protein [Rhodoferax sp. PAMC 29310]|jgi:hypothetical protein|uniref:DUF3460 family protein n=1 Tax=Rhodoferax sp. PAMC 29310 TaxID=2822760 RepID=UPI001B335C89|nr:DUF3460 family protein [Rhodoferax sp. PAMC 29310]